jgi:hypothetical protein
MGGSAAHEIADGRDRKRPGNGPIDVPAIDLRKNSDAETIGAGIVISAGSLTVRRAGDHVGGLRTKNAVGRFAVADARCTMRAQRRAGRLRQQKRGQQQPDAPNRYIVRQTQAHRRSLQTPAYKLFKKEC